jgi:pimeloyl-ACP methyl ester carboxylesterase
MRRPRAATLALAGVGLAAIALLVRRSAMDYRSSVAGVRSQWTTIPAITGGSTLRIHSRVAGHRVPDASAAVLVHGYGIGTTYFVPLVASLGKHMRVYAPDLPGHGPSDHDVRPLTIPELCDALSRWMDSLSLRSALVIAHSLGCQVAAELATQRPDLVRGLLLVGPTSDPAHGTVRQQVGRVIASAVFERPSLMICIAQDYWRAGLRVLVQEMRQMITHRIEDVLPRVKAPTLVARGENDHVAPQAWVETVARVAAAPPPIVVPRWGHAVHYDDPAALVKIALAFRRNFS